MPIRKVVEVALRHGVTNTEEAVRKELDRAGLITSGKECTTREMLALEAGLVRYARSGQGACPSVRPGGINAGVLPASKTGAEYVTPAAGQSNNLNLAGGLFQKVAPNLNSGQLAAVNHVLTSKDRVVLVRGASGTGKTFMLETAAPRSCVRPGCRCGPLPCPRMPPRDWRASIPMPPPWLVSCSRRKPRNQPGAASWYWTKRANWAPGTRRKLVAVLETYRRPAAGNR